MKNVNALLKKEQQAKDILANIGREKEDLAIKKLAEVKEILAALDCSYLLETTTIEKVVEKVVEVEVVKEVNPVNVTITKGKIVKVPGKVQVVQDMTEIEKHLDTIAAQKKEIESLKKSIAKWKEIAEAAQKDFEAKDKQIADMQAAIKTKEVVETSEEDDYMAFLASQEESIMSEINYYEQQEPVVEEPVKEEVKEDKKTEKEEKKNIDAPQYVKMSNSKVGKNPNAKLYQTEKCYLIASPTTDEITWLSHEKLSDEYKIAVENMLVQDYKFLPNRTKLSPIKINRDNAYMARSSAIKGVTEFSMEDVLVGYVKLNGKFYLYSYSPKFARPSVDSLDAIIAKKSKTMPSMSIVTKVTAEVIDMYKEYKALLDANKKEADKKAEESAKSFNDKVEARRAQRKNDEALIANAGLLSKIKKNKNNRIPSAVDVLNSSILDDIEADLF